MRLDKTDTTGRADTVKRNLVKILLPSMNQYFAPTFYYLAYLSFFDTSLKFTGTVVLELKNVKQTF